MLQAAPPCAAHAQLRGRCPGRRRRSAARGCSASAAPQPGRVWIVGAGPGGVEHLTIGAGRVLAACDAVVYDDLAASEDILALAPPHAERVYMGKRGGGGSASSPQASIDERLVQLARAGLRVVRLKGGCPSVFGRVSSEARALAAAGVRFELLPGVSSALAAPLLAGFPLTDAELSRSFAVATAHDLDALDFRTLAVGVDTAVLLMGARNLGAIAEAMVAAGRPACTPVAVVRWAGTARQRVFEGELGSIARDTAGEELSPAVVIVGEVVRLRSEFGIGRARGADEA